MADRLAENGAVLTGQSAVASTASRLGGAGQIEKDMVTYKATYTQKVSGLTVKGRLINKAVESL